MTGGSAARAGFNFQDKVSGFLAVHMLANIPIEILDLPTGNTPIRIDLETTAPVDDILVSTSGEGLCFLNVKSTVTNSNNPKSHLGSVIDQFVRLWIACRSGHGPQHWQRPLSRERDRLMLITSPKRSASFTRSFSSVLARIADRNSLHPVEMIAATKHERRVYDAVLSLVRTAARRHWGEEFSDSEMASLLGMVRTSLLYLDGTDKSNSLNLLRQSVVESPSDTENAWLQVVSFCQTLAERRSGADRTALRTSLRRRGVRLLGIPEMRADIRRLEHATEQELANLEHLACLDVPTANGSKRFEIRRSVTQVLTEHAPNTSMLVIGEPGSGKSGSIYSAARQLVSNGFPVVAIAVDRHPMSSLDALRNDLQLEHEFLDVLQNWPSERRGVLFIDALDASRGGPSDRLFQDLIRGVVERVPNWNVVASIRSFDLKFGARYRNLFRGSPIESKYADNQFGEIQHLSIPKLTDEELAQVWLTSPPMREAYHNGTNDLKELLRSPFNLFLLTNVLSAGTLDLSHISTQLQLLHLYWSHRVIGSDQQGFAREGFLRTALSKMIEQHQLWVSIAAIPQVRSTDLAHLLSEGVIRSSSVSGPVDQVSRIAFSHHVLFDYGVSRLVFESGSAPDLVPRLAGSDEDALVTAPGAMMAFQSLWEEDPQGRSKFWTKSLELVKADCSGAFSRMLPARIAASLTVTVEDFKPVLDCLAGADDADRKAALFLARHCIGALTADVVQRSFPSTPREPWPRIAQELIRLAIEDASWILKPLIAQWVESPSNLASDEKRYIGATARKMLVYGVREPYMESIVNVAIQAVVRTFESAPEESFESLKLLLDRDHVSEHGHIELFCLVREFKYLLQQMPNTTLLIDDIYRAAYCTPLPSSNDRTNLSGSRILGMISNKRQDFEGVRYQLFEAFPDYFSADPKTATETLVDLVECSFGSNRESNEPVTELVVHGAKAHYQPDPSHVGLLRLDDERTPPLRQFESGLVTLVDDSRTADIDRVLSVVVRRNRLAATWAALIKAAARRPEVLGPRLLDVVTAKPVLEGLDTFEAASDLVATLHPLLDESGRKEIELAVLATDPHTGHGLLGRLQADNIVSTEARTKRAEWFTKGEPVNNREPFQNNSIWRAGDDWWFHEQGVDLSNEENARLRKTISIVEDIRKLDSEGPPKLGLVEKSWSHVEELRAALESRLDIPEALLMSGWHALAAAAGEVAETARNCNDLVRFPGIGEIIRRALRSDFWPSATSDPEVEREFARAPGWGSPSPRVEAAGALMALCRVSTNLEIPLVHLVESLARDPSPAVRHQILGRVNMLFKSNKPLMYRLCEIALSEERNEGVSSFFLATIRTVLSERPEWFAERLLALDDRLCYRSTESVRDDSLEHLVGLLLRLWLVFDQNTVETRIREWIADPISHFAHVQHAVPALRKAIVQGNPEKKDPTNERVRTGAVEFFEGITLHLVELLSRLGQKSNLAEDEEGKTTATTALNILHTVAMEIFFGSGAHDVQRGPTDAPNNDPSVELVRTRFLREMTPTLCALARVYHPSVTHRLLETLETFIAYDPKLVFRMVTDALIEGGQRGGYQFESLGSDLFVGIVRRYLADYRSVLDSDIELRRRLMASLDIFVEAGWPAARRLVYELPETLR